MIFLLIYFFINSLLNIKIQKELHDVMVSNGKDGQENFWFYFFVNAIGILFAIPLYIFKVISNMRIDDTLEDK